jgi:hypothetical protein
VNLTTGELAVLVVAGVVFVLAGVRGYRRGRVVLSPTRGIDYPGGSPEVRGRRAVLYAAYGIVAGVALIVYAAVCFVIQRK